MADRDLYAILGVPRDASEAQIRKAYRELARKYHPDRNPGDSAAEDRFKDASFASDVLLNKEKRKKYDEFGEVGLKEGFNADAARRYAGGGFGGGGDFSLEDLFGGFANAQGGEPGWRHNVQDAFGANGPDIMEAIFGNVRRKPPPRDLATAVTIDFADAVRGTEKQLALAAPDGTKTLKVRIPAGVTDGGKVRLRGQGLRGGDILLTVHVRSHPNFDRAGDDLLLDLPISVGEAFHGAGIQVPTPEGNVTLRIPPRTHGGSKLRLRGKGVKRGKRRGDLIVRVQIQLPEAEAEAEAEGLADAVDGVEKAYRRELRGDLKL